MKFKKLFKVLRPYQYIKVTRMENGSFIFSDIVLFKDFLFDNEELEYRVLSIYSAKGLVNKDVVDFLNIIIDKGGNF